MLGDPARGLTHERLEAMRQQSLSLLATGALALICALWLCGFSFVAAKRRSILVLVLLLSPLVFLVYGVTQSQGAL
jgi:hypothetical protein